MAKYRITTKYLRTTNGVRIEPGMSVEVITPTIGNPVVNNGGTLVQQAFLRIYGVDIKKAGCLNMGELSVGNYSAIPDIYSAYQFIKP